MIDFSNIKYGIILAMIAILFGGLLGLSFGCCEDTIKDILKSGAQASLDTKYEGKQEQADKVVKKSWVYLKRAHLHSQTMGVIAIAFSILVAWLGFSPLLQTSVSLLSGFGSLCYGVFWLLAGGLAPGMGSTHDAKHAVELVAQAGGGSFFVAGVLVFSLLVYKLFLAKPSPGNLEQP